MEVLFIVRTRNNRILISLNDNELQHVNDLAKISGVSREEYTRMLYRGVIPPPVISKEVNDVLKQLRRIGNNINQIAYIANTTEDVNYDSFMKCYEELQGVIFNFKELLTKPKELVIEDGNNKDMGSEG